MNTSYSGTLQSIHFQDLGMICLHLYFASLTINISNVKSRPVTDNAVLPLFFRVKNYFKA